MPLVLRTAALRKLVFCLLLAATGASSLQAQKNVSGSVRTRLALERLNHTARVLMIAAHPDDENTALLAWLARGQNVRTGYLSLTRGEGGQNLIGSEQGHVLGLIRTEELLAARRIDGAEQFFTSAVDFGFSKTAEEALRIWNREQVLGDVVYVIRKFRPDVIILRFSGTPRDGHGQHQASAILGKEAFAAAADPKRYPEQLTGGIQPWQAKRVLWNVFAFTPQQEKEAEALKDKIAVDLGDFNPDLGYSYAEIAGMSRSEHQSQGMGSAERKGSQRNYLVHVAGDPAKASLFDGVRNEWADASLRTLLRDAADAWNPWAPQKTVELLLKARPLMPEERRAELEEAIARCANLWLDASATPAMAAPGTPVKIRVEAVNRSPLPMKLIAVQAAGGQPAASLPAPLANNVLFSGEVQWTAREIRPERHRAMPDAPPVLEARFNVEVNGVPLTYTRPVRHRYVDKVRGELTRPFVTVPPVSLSFAERSLLFPSAEPRTVAVHIRSYAGKQSGAAALNLPGGWKVQPDSVSFSLGVTGEEQTLNFRVTPPAAGQTVPVAARAKLASGTEVHESVQVIDYPHIQPITLYADARAALVRSDVRVLSKRIGYIMGAGDAVPDALRQMGCEVTLLSAEDLARGDLASRFDAIVTGVRAWNVRPDLRASQPRLLEFMNAGGTVVVQYNTAEGGPFDPVTGALDRIGPYPLKIGRDRVTHEDSPVEILKAAHPLLTSPNTITAKDFAGWIQERGLYFASEWDPRYETVVETHDPGDKPLPGGLLYTRYGKGAYVFTAYSWFRELPAGVPGAYRIFANLLSAGQSEAQGKSGGQ